MSGVNVSLIGGEKLLAALDRVESKSDRGIINAVYASAFRIQASARRAAAVDMGRLRSSIFVRFLDGGHSAEVGTDVEHGKFVESGRKPGSMPPLGPLKDWAKRVLGDEGAAFAVARKIAARGIPARPFLTPAYEREEPKFRARIQKILGEAVK